MLIEQHICCFHTKTIAEAYFGTRPGSKRELCKKKISSYIIFSSFKNVIVIHR